MTTHLWTIRRLAAVDETQVDELASVLIDCVEGGASVSFMSPLTRERAVAFWRHVARGVAARHRAVLVAEDAAGICGTVQLVFDLPAAPNQGNLWRVKALKAKMERSGDDIGVPLKVSMTWNPKTWSEAG